jgi:hypothetical protein
MQYQLIALKNSVQLGSSVLFVTDFLTYSSFVKTIALKTNNFFSIGP